MKDIWDSLLCEFTLFFFLVNKIIDKKNHVHSVFQRKSHECTLASISAGSEDFLLSFGIITLYCSSM